MSRRKQAHAEGHVNHERWLLTYADLITLLMVFFVILYSMSKQDVAKYAKLTASIQRAFNIQVLEGLDATAVHGRFGSFSSAQLHDLETIKQDLGAFAEQLGLGDKIVVRPSREGITISLSSSLLFESGKADLRPESRTVLQKVAALLSKMPNEVRVEGHTDNIPPASPLYPTNWELSTARALAVTRYLITLGIRPERLSAAGYGEYRPIADNSTKEGRAANRRADLVVLYPDAVVVSEEPVQGGATHKP
jgi:chemotaxis protein MotB